MLDRDIARDGRAKNGIAGGLNVVVPNNSGGDGRNIDRVAGAGNDIVVFNRHVGGIGRSGGDAAGQRKSVDVDDSIRTNGQGTRNFRLVRRARSAGGRPYAHAGIGKAAKSQRAVDGRAFVVGL